jgi:hypothetical protein
MRPLRSVGVTAIALLMLAAACTEEAPEDEPLGGSSGPPSGTITAKDFDAANFDDPTTIDNRYFPLQPGTKFVYEGATEGGKEQVHHRVVMIVTDLTKEILGVRNVAIWERDYSDGELVENELAFFAQDNDGNVWHFGQYPEEYENGELAETPAWIAGIAGARTGITIKADPQLGGPSYSQGFAPPPINWIDRARVYQMNQQTCVPVACYQDVLVTEEFERTKPGAFQLKFYAPGVGTVRVGWRGRNEKERETLVLVKVAPLSPRALARVREQALATEARAYAISPDVYGQTAPLEAPGS